MDRDMRQYASHNITHRDTLKSGDVFQDAFVLQHIQPTTYFLSDTPIIHRRTGFIMVFFCIMLFL